MNHNNFDLIQEIYLTEEQATNWLGLTTGRPHFFKLPDEIVVLKDMYPYVEIQSPPLYRSDTDVMVDRSLEWAAKFSGRFTGTMAKQRDVSRPKPTRKLERPCNALWTLFLHNDLVIGVHDDSTIMVRDLDISTPLLIRVTPQGDFYYCGRVQSDAHLTMPPTMVCVGLIRDGVQLWVRRAKGRKMPLGLQRLWKRTLRANDVNLRR